MFPTVEPGAPATPWAALQSPQQAASALQMLSGWGRVGDGKASSTNKEGQPCPLAPCAMPTKAKVPAAQQCTIPRQFAKLPGRAPKGSDAGRACLLHAPKQMLGQPAPTKSTAQPWMHRRDC
jgi:hypothetical protein